MPMDSFVVDGSFYIIVIIDPSLSGIEISLGISSI